MADGEELEDLDLDSELDESITVVEWGAGMAEQLSSDHLDITITPVWDDDAAAAGGNEPVGADDADEDERRIIDLTGRGAAWAERMSAVEAAVSALPGVRVDGPASADRPAEDSAKEGDES